ncbi:MAG: nucleotidyltransferase [Oscillospiraceae bacterium]|jgi:NDP-sugar pyrophosphorylase family protein|nr:nucleotidyltransferase [Oscillospiraceae bacterium]
MKKPTLVVMAAGMGSRFGGLKQMEAIDPQGNSILHYSIYDAIAAGFGKVVFIIKREIEADFKEKICKNLDKYIRVSIVYQEIDKLPAGYTVPEGRTRPWGTGHAVLCAKDEIDGPFAVINADDFYGRGAFAAIAQFLLSAHADNEYAMAGYLLRNAMTDNGYVARGVCEQQDGYLVGITERTHIEKHGDDALYLEDGVYYPLRGNTVVSMNLWGFSTRILEELARRFPKFLDENVPQNPLRCEFFLPTVANAQIHEGLGTVRVLETDETWYGVTYREDLQSVQDAVAAMRAAGKYPQVLFP